MDFAYTARHVARGSRPDTRDGNVWFLIKSPEFLRLTYQIRLLTFGAKEDGCKLVILVPKATRLSRDLRSFVKRNSKVVRIKRTDP